MHKSYAVSPFHLLHTSAPCPAKSIKCRYIVSSLIESLSAYRHSHAVGSLSEGGGGGVRERMRTSSLARLRLDCWQRCVCFVICGGSGVWANFGVRRDQQQRRCQRQRCLPFCGCVCVIDFVFVFVAVLLLSACDTCARAVWMYVCVCVYFLYRGTHGYMGTRVHLCVYRLIHKCLPCGRYRRISTITL